MELKKQLGFWDVFCIATGSMISSGIFILPGLAFVKTGPSVFLSYLIAGILGLTGALSVAELSSAMPKAGGDYFFITRTFGPLVGTVSGLLSWFSLSLKTAFAIIGIAEIIFVLTNFGIIPCAVLVTIFFVILNIVGVKESGRFEIIIVMGLLILIIFFVITGLPKVKIMNFHPFVFQGFNGIIFTAGYVFVSYGGLLKIASISEEVKDPKKNLPLGILVSLIIVTILYSLMLIVVVGVLDRESLKKSITPIADAARTFLNTPGFVALTIAAMLAFISTANAGILSASRYPFALGRDNLVPDFISKVSQKFKTPVVSIIITGIFIIISLFLGLDLLIKAASTVVIITYILSNLSVIILRQSSLQNYKPSFKSPLYPWLQIIGSIVFIFLIIDVGLSAILISFVLVGFGVLFYFVYGRINSKKNYALLSLIANIMNKEFSSSQLEQELKDILSHRDNIIFDRFDKVIDNARVVIIDDVDTMELDSFFKKVSTELSQITGLSNKKSYELFKKREEESSTAISNFVAIPHIVIDGTKKFDMIIVKSKNGIKFSDTFNSVKAVFIMTGTKDERNFHLQSLSAIAQIIQKKEFRKKWINAKNIQALKDLIHLSDRHRINIKN